MHWPLKRIGRPPGPSGGRGLRPWDPRQLTLREYAILRFVAANPDMPKWLIAERFGISPQRLSILSCCPLGQMFLKALRKLHRARRYRVRDAPTKPRGNSQCRWRLGYQVLRNGFVSAASSPLAATPSGPAGVHLGKSHREARCTCACDRLFALASLPHRQFTWFPQTPGASFRLQAHEIGSTSCGKKPSGTKVRGQNPS